MKNVKSASKKEMAIFKERVKKLMKKVKRKLFPSLKWRNRLATVTCSD